MRTVTLRQVIDSGAWDRFCELTGVNPWCVAEGADGSAAYTLTDDQFAELGISLPDPAAAELTRLREVNADLIAALEFVLKSINPMTVEANKARAAIAKAKGNHS